MKDFTTFKRVANQIVKHLRNNDPVTIKPSPKIADNFEEVLDFIAREEVRLQKIRENAGRPMKTEGPLSRSTLWMRDHRARQKAEKEGRNTSSSECAPNELTN